MKGRGSEVAEASLWLNKMLAEYGSPTTAVPEWTRMAGRTRRGWAWTVDGQKRGIHIDKVWDWYETEAWNHAARTAASFRSTAEPTDSEVLILLGLVGMFSGQVANE